MDCKNCRYFIPENGKYCLNCGAKVVTERLSFRHLTDEFSQQFLNWDNRFIFTIKHLFKNPSKVISEYVDGVRKRYINPLSFFAISLTISGVYLFLMQKYFPDVLDMSQYFDNPNQKLGNQKLTSFVYEYNSFISFIIIPGVAFISWIVFWNKKYNYIEHCAIYFYTMPLFSMCTSIVTLLAALFLPFQPMLLSIGLWLIFFFYSAILLKKLFGLSWKSMVLKTLFFIPLFFMAYLAFSFLILGIGILTGVIEFKDFIPQKP
ncbi:DUF3667 domain-containing protein [Aegicerativicinus sediminis]